MSSFTRLEHSSGADNSSFASGNSSVPLWSLCFEESNFEAKGDFKASLTKALLDDLPHVVALSFRGAPPLESRNNESLSTREAERAELMLMVQELPASIAFLTFDQSALSGKSVGMLGDSLGIRFARGQLLIGHRKMSVLHLCCVLL